MRSSIFIWEETEGIKKMALEFDKAEAFDLLKMLVTTNTVNPPGNEAVLAEKIKNYLAAEGIESKLEEAEPNRANLIIRYAGVKHEPALLVTGHLDTVPVGGVEWKFDPFSCAVDGDLVYGRGTSDMKSGDAAFLYALVLMKRRGIVPPQDIVICLTCGEENCCVGARDFVKRDGMKGIGATLIAEPSNAEALVAHKGAYWVKVKFYGQTAHGSMPHLGINAVTRAAKFVLAINAQKFNCTPDPWLGMPTFSLNMLHGGMATNVVPDYAECTIDFRIIPGQTQRDIEEFIDSALATAGAGDDQFKADYEFLLDALPIACPAGDKILDALDEAAGKKLVRRGVNYYTDGSTFVGNNPMPVVVYGPGDDKQAHQPNEHITLTSYYDAVEVYYNFMSHYSLC